MVAAARGLGQRLPVDRLAPVVDAGRTRLRAGGDSVQQVGQVRVPALRQRVQHNVEQKFLEFNDFCPDAAAGFPPSIGIKI